VITLGTRSFAGPFMAPLWLPRGSAGVYAVLTPGWRLLTFRALDFDQTEDFAGQDLLKQHSKYGEWLRIVGTEWNLYVATLELPLSTEAQREATLRALRREYRPGFKPMLAPEAPSLNNKEN
jgi:hypothetical protein